MNALISITEINSLYDQRPVVEKQASYAFVHPFAEALGGIVSDLPVKFISAIFFNVIFYFLAGLVGGPKSVTSLVSNLLTSSSDMSHPSFSSSFSLHSSAHLQCLEFSVLLPQQRKHWHKRWLWPV